jgi:hypothetical protein
LEFGIRTRLRGSSGMSEPDHEFLIPNSSFQIV